MSINRLIFPKDDGATNNAAFSADLKIKTDGDDFADFFQQCKMMDETRPS
jgi:hypothetical protein